MYKTTLYTKHANRQPVVRIFEQEDNMRRYINDAIYDGDIDVEKFDYERRCFEAIEYFDELESNSIDVMNY